MEIIYDPKPLTADQLQLISQDVKRTLTDLYGARLDRVILYGSYARGDFHAESDVDYLVVLTDDEVKSGREIKYMIDPVCDLCDKYDVSVSVKPTSSIKYQFSDLSFYSNVRRDGKWV